ncbi:MAG: NAD(P)-dependent oxidoreductase [Candidatus Heteroscillospira sp.]|jgi:3-hydroxyisobutyrate dehydrogenase
MVIGVFGIGRMGFPIACNLADDGHKVLAYDVFSAAREKLAETKVEWSPTPREVVEQAELIFFVGLQCNQLKAMLDGTDGVLAGINAPGKVIIDLSTSDPTDSAELGKYLSSQGIDYLDCGMTGGVVGARGRNLVFMAGGDRAVYDRCTPVLEKLSKSMTFVGPQGCGHRMKLLHNAVSNSVFNVTIEACALGKLYGMDLQAMIDVMNVGNARSYATEVRFPKYIIPGTYDQGYTFSTGCKDFSMILKIAKEMNYKMPMAEATYDYWTWAVEQDLPDGDITTLYKLIEKKNSQK